MRCMGNSVFVIGLCIASTALAQTVRFEADTWVAECGAAPDSDCSIIGVFKSTGRAGPENSYSLLVDLRNRMVAVVGKPSPTAATIRIDRSPALACRGETYCIFSTSDAEIIMRQLKSGSLVLIDVLAGKNTFRASISTKGYQADLGYGPPGRMMKTARISMQMTAPANITNPVG